MANAVGAYERNQQTNEVSQTGSAPQRQPQQPASGKFGVAPEDTVTISAEAKEASLLGQAATEQARASSLATAQSTNQAQQLAVNVEQQNILPQTVSTKVG